MSLKKIVLFATTENIFKIKELFEKVPVSIDFVLFNKNFGTSGQYDFGDFTSQSILIQDSMIPLYESTQNRYTVLQKKRLQGFGKEIERLKNLIISSRALTEKHSDSFEDIVSRLAQAPQKDNKIFVADQVKDLKVDQKTGRIRCEVSQSELLEYDHVLLENNDLVFEFISQFVPRAIQQRNVTSFQFVGVQFAASDEFTDNHFWFVDDHLYESLYDNVYFISSKKSQVDCWTWIPEQQLRSQEYFKFLSQRIRNRLEEKFDFLSFSPTSAEFMVQPLNAAHRFEVKNRNFSAFPHFNFLNQNQVYHLFWNEIERLNKRVQFYVPPKQKDLNV